MLTPTAGSPAALGYRMPAEWEAHEGVWLSWPHNEATWPGNFGPIPGVFAEIAMHLSQTGLVRINVRDQEMAAEVERLLWRLPTKRERIRFHLNPTNDAWLRDHGPIYVVREAGGRVERALTDWKYHSWGGKYPPYDLDNKIPGRIAVEFGEPRFDAGIVMEGGSIEVNGKGTLLTTTACLLNKNRNPELSREKIEQYLCDFLGARHILWLGDGIVGDDTDGHIDDLTRFVSADTVVTMVEEDRKDENYEPLAENLKRLKTMRDQDGKLLNVVTIPMPGAIYFDDRRLPASYANFLVTNSQVLVPTYRHANDEAAMATLGKVFPGKKVVGIDCTELVWGLGAIHCLTQQQPAAG